MSHLMFTQSLCLYLWMQTYRKISIRCTQDAHQAELHRFCIVRDLFQTLYHIVFATVIQISNTKYESYIFLLWTWSKTFVHGWTFIHDFEKLRTDEFNGKNLDVYVKTASVATKINNSIYFPIIFIYIYNVKGTTLFHLGYYILGT